MSNIPLKKIPFLLIILVVGLMVWPETSLAQIDLPPALLQIEVRDGPQLDQFITLNIPIYTTYQDEQGNKNLLLLAEWDTQIQLDEYGFVYRVLDSDARDASYYLVYTPPPFDLSIIQESARILETSSLFLVVRGRPGDMLILSQSGVEVQRLISHPIGLPKEQAVVQGITAISPDPAIQDMINQVSSSTAHDYIGDLSGEWNITVNDRSYRFFTRYSLAPIPIKLATKFVYEHFVNLGLTTYFDHYDLEGTELRHVIAEQPGITNPDCIVLLVGHLDSTSNDPYNNAPGADDNASGSTGVLMAADILHSHSFACTLRYVHFTGEEQVVLNGYFGSKFYAQEVADNDEDIIAVINLDMIGYNSDQYEIIELHTRENNAGDLAIANTFKNVIQAYDINLTTQIIQDGLSWSDHASFWNVGYHAILAMEDFQDFTPYYHSTNDQLNTINTTYLADFIRAAIGTVAHLAVPVSPSTEQIFIPFIILKE